MSIALTLPLGEAINAGQHRLSTIQVINWGTFHGRHTMYVDRAGTLLTGHPGVGKSTLFDGIAHIFAAAPRLNESAHDASNRKDRRTTYSYMRGRRFKTAAGTSYQRPGATWSAIALVYEDGLGHSTCIAALFDLPVNGLEGTVGKHYVIHNGPLDTEALEAHGSRRFSPSSLHKALPGCEAFDTHKTFAERFRRRLGIDNDKAFSLLRTLQSGKGLDKGVNQFFRYEVLEIPSTLQAAAGAVEDFSHLRGIYRQLEDARGQRDALAQVPAQYRRYRELQELLGRNAELAREQLPLIRRQRSAALLRREAERLGQVRAAAAEQLEAEAAAKDELAARVRLLEEQHENHGGKAIDALEREIRAAQLELAERERIAQQLRKDLDDAGLEAQWSADGLSAARREAADAVGRLTEEAAAARTLEYEAVAASMNARQREAKLRTEIESYTRRGSNIDGASAAARRQISAATGIDAADMPFAGELADIAGEHQRWRPAAEKALRTLATTLLVRGEHLRAVTAAIDALDGYGRLRWINIGTGAFGKKAAEAGPADLVGKLEFQNSEAGNWLRAKIAADYPFVCVDSDADLHRHEKAISLAGTIKLNAGTFERDTRTISPGDYLLGFSNTEKIVQLQAEADRIRAEHERASELADERSKAKDALAGRLEALQRVAADTRPFAELDSAARRGAVEALQQRLRALMEDSTTLARIRAELEEAKSSLEAAVGRVAVLRSELDAAGRQAAKVAAELADTGRRAAEKPPADWAVEALAEFLDPGDGEGGEAAALERLEAAFHAAQLKLGEAAAALKDELHRTGTALTDTFKSFAREWGPQLNASFGTGVESAPHYEALYHSIIDEGLPQREDEFREYFNNRSYERFSDLLQLLEEERRAIEERILPLNQILDEVPFDNGSHLRLEVRTAIPEEARVFRNSLKNALGNAYVKQSAEQMADSYKALEKLVDDLNDQAKLPWRNTVLDVRQHVTISCNEHRPGGEVETGLEPGTLSGGEGQRFTSFIMGAALAYQLGFETQGFTTYGTVMIDEAFIQANSEYAGAGINALQEFGFQLLLAAPEDKVDLSRHLGSITDIIKHPDSNVSGFVESGISPATATEIVLR
ncbi:ATP-binding protein [Arthrobacter mobilis]|uniref:Chromosome segregation protein SMC n=1 Tax=Arthrobacter mobilis TaxID=2724944 RepID=A0A7X6HAW9_9MICC|nr:ATP-binding protein [Arthrobacter mobilis]NKX52994.1 chromosome segregation protein SMC [Arthrobacter mobilis]